MTFCSPGHDYPGDQAAVAQCQEHGVTRLYHGDPITQAELPAGLGAPSPCDACMAAVMFDLVSPHACTGSTTITGIGTLLFHADPRPCPCSCLKVAERTRHVRATLDRAEKLLRGRPAPQDLRAVTARLRAHAAAILPEASASEDELPSGAPERDLRRSRLRSIQRHMDEEPARGALPAHSYLDILRLECAWLLSEYGPGAGP
ncbi:DUF6415 family natural product biosynthesis protein [Streptomyces sp. NPDC087851]|uniref:DUF6415 family natural product biosynthesis protein n=1 Tax=Streptomyces sp. NPDC087851 TaxID=3365810 RepID=UPI003814436E